MNDLILLTIKVSHADRANKFVKFS